MRLSWHTLRGVPGKKKNHQQRVLLSIIGSIEVRNRCETVSHEAKKNVVFARQCTAHKNTDLRFQLLPHVPHSSDLAPLDYYLLPNLKTCFINKKFEQYQIVEKLLK